VLLGVAASLCGALLATGCSSQDAADAAPLRTQAAQLRALERPVLRSVKLAFIATAAHRDDAAAENLERAAERGVRVRTWLDGHEGYAKANEPSVECLEETLGELHERAELWSPKLRDGSLEPGDRTELRHGLAEAANCVQASD
jgi:hypothetical protein